MRDDIRYVRQGQPVRLVQQVCADGRPKCLWCGNRISVAYLQKVPAGYFCKDRCAVAFALNAAKQAVEQSEAIAGHITSTLAAAERKAEAKFAPKPRPSPVAIPDALLGWRDRNGVWHPTHTGEAP